MSDILAASAGKFGQMALVIAVFFGVLLLVFVVAARATGRLQKPITALVFLGPAVLLMLAGLLIPALRTFVYSLYGPDGTAWVGGANYTWAFTNPQMRIVLRNTVLWIVVAPLLSTVFGLTLALLSDRTRRRSESTTTSLIFMPMAISMVGASIIWKFVYQYIEPTLPQIGLLSQVLIWLGVKNPPNWILWTPWNNCLLIVIMVWIQTGFAMVVLSAAIGAIPGDVLEAASLDGATGWKPFARVTVPLIRGTLVVVLTTITIAVLKIFDIVQTMTGGNFDTSVLANEMYSPSVVQADNGHGSALAVILFLGIVPLIVYNVRHSGDAPARQDRDHHRAAHVRQPRHVGLRRGAHRPVDGADLRPPGDLVPAQGGRRGLRLVDRVHPTSFTLDNDDTVLVSGGYNVSGGLLPYLVNSLVISIPVTLFALALASMAAYAIAWVPFRFNDVAFFTIVALQVVPLQLALIPLLRLVNLGVHLGPVPIVPALHLSGTFFAVWIAHTMFAMPLAIFLLHNVMAQLPKDVMEARRVDGANASTTFRQIVLPLSTPAIAWFAIVQFLWVWNDLLVALTFVGGGDAAVSPLTSRLAQLTGSLGSRWDLLTAGAFVSIVIPLIVIFSLQRYVVRVLLAGSVKG